MADTPDTPMNVEPAVDAKGLFKSRTIWLIIAAGLVNIGAGVAGEMQIEWLSQALMQLQLLLLGASGQARSVASGPLK